MVTAAVVLSNVKIVGKNRIEFGW